MPAAIKQLVVLRRRAGQTTQEFFDHHYQKHGALSDPSAPEETPLTYYQTHFFDAAYNNTSLAQPAWTGHNDATELYFDNEAHVGRVFGSTYVRNVIGPDGANFNDFAATIAMFTQEQLISGSASVEQGVEQAIVAMYYLQARDTTADVSKTFPEHVHPLIAQCFGDVSVKVVANVALPDPHNQLKYFQAEAAPSYSVAYQVYLRDKGQIPAFRQAQKKLEESVDGSLVKTESAFVVFGVRSVVFDQAQSIKFDVSRQPRLP
ncbi:hypothetical protein LTR36_006723 [Oleoguttula mirabilis]|uniref:EthD domain-containing protein n=1 Tax=Oleoguttula mirabilis TaxID=1507867 RepID=A0AAV9JBG0_9PEZI|nr:hypothetical protein LTR36_006723 [Oleoguttula mirabilis]